MNPTEAVDERLGELFRRLPLLSGFSLEQDLELKDVTLHTWPGYTPGPELYVEVVMETLADLVEERPDAAELLRGRTFARALH